MRVAGEGFTLFSSPFFCNECRARCCISGCCGECEGEGKNGKFAESTSAYIRVGACPARRVEWEFVRGREVLRETREEVAKSGEVLRESRLVFLSGVGEGEKNNFSCLLVLGLFRVVRLLFDFVHWLFRDGLVFFVLVLVFGQNLPRFDIASSVVR